MGVDIFFLLSGIGLTYSIKKSTIRRFYYKRFRRIIFPFLAVGILRAVVENWGVRKFIGNITGFNFWTVSIYSFLWFIPAIVMFYLIFPLYNHFLKKIPEKIEITAIVLSLWLIGATYLEDFIISKGRMDLYGFINRIPIFLIGVMFGHIAQNRKLHINKIKWLVIITLNILGMYFADLTNFHSVKLIVPVSNCCIPNILLAVSITFLLAKWFDRISNCKFGMIMIKIFQLLGMISLELYCVQEFIGDMLLKYFSFPNNVLKNLVLFSGILFSAVIIYFLEIYLWKLIDKIFSN